MKRRLWLLFLIVLVGFCSFLYKTFYDDAKERAIDSLNERQKLHARQAALGIEDYLTNMINSLNLLTRSEDIATLNLSGKKLMETFYETHKERIQTLIRMDPNGRIIYSVPYKGAIGNDISRQKHVQEVMSSHKPVMSDVFRAVQGLDVVALHIPVFNKGRYDGTIGIGMNFHFIARRYVEGIQIGKTGYAWMISRDGTEVYCPIPGHTGKTVFENCKDFPSILAMAEEMVKGREGITTYVFNRVRGQVAEGVRKHAVYLPVKVGNTFWSIAVASSEEEILASLANFRNRLFLIIGLILLGGGLFSFYGLKSVFIVQEEQKRKRAEEALRRSEKEATRLARENALIAEIGRIISSTPKIEEVYPLFSQKVMELIPFDRIGINLINLKEGTHTVPYVAGPSVSGRQPGDMAPMAGTLLEKVLQSQKGIIIRMDREEEVAAEFPGLLPDFQEGFRSGLTVPLISGGEVIGGLALRSKGIGVYTDRDLRLAEGIGDQIAGAITNAQLYTEQRKVEEALRENEAIFSSFLEHSPVYIFFKDKAIRSLRLSKNYEQLLGMPIHQALGKTMDELFPSELSKSMVADDLRILTESKRMVIVEEFHGRTYETTKFPIFKDDEPFMLAGFTVDITERKLAEEKREKIIKELQEAVSKIKTLSGMLPICSSCKKVRDDKGYWNQIEVYIRDHSEAEFTHGICPECFKKLYPNEPLEDL